MSYDFPPYQVKHYKAIHKNYCPEPRALTCMTVLKEKIPTTLSFLPTEILVSFVRKAQKLHKLLSAQLKNDAYFNNHVAKRTAFSCL